MQIRGVKEVGHMKKVLAKKVLDKEASFWTSRKLAVKNVPTKGCHK